MMTMVDDFGCWIVALMKPREHAEEVVGPSRADIQMTKVYHVFFHSIAQ